MAMLSPISGHFDPQAAFICHASGKKIEHYNTGLLGWLLHLFGRAVWVDVKDTHENKHRLYVPLNEVKKICPQLEHKPDRYGIGHDFVAELQAASATLEERREAKPLHIEERVEAESSQVEEMRHEEHPHLVPRTGEPLGEVRTKSAIPEMSMTGKALEERVLTCLCALDIHRPGMHMRFNQPIFEFEGETYRLIPTPSVEADEVQFAIDCTDIHVTFCASAWLRKDKDGGLAYENFDEIHDREGFLRAALQAYHDKLVEIDRANAQDDTGVRSDRCILTALWPDDVKKWN